MNYKWLPRCRSHTVRAGARLVTGASVWATKPNRWGLLGKPRMFWPALWARGAEILQPHRVPLHVVMYRGHAYPLKHLRANPRSLFHLTCRLAGSPPLAVNIERDGSSPVQPRHVWAV